MPLEIWKSLGFRGIASGLRDRVVGTRSSLAGLAADAVRSKAAVEIGGPSSTFGPKGVLPLYGELRSIDNVNFAHETLWEEELTDGQPYRPLGDPTGVQFLREATELVGIEEHAYDVVLSSHCLEHVANPLRALKEWRRVCRPSGYLCLILPHRDGSFDRRRPLTTLEHLRADEEMGVAEDDSTHFAEVLALHDLRRDRMAGSHHKLQARVVDNASIRGVHHHVFNLANAVQAVLAGGWTPLAAEARRPFHIVVIAANQPSGGDRSGLGGVMRKSPFRSDRG